MDSIRLVDLEVALGCRRVSRRKITYRIIVVKVIQSCENIHCLGQRAVADRLIVEALDRIEVVIIHQAPVR